MAGACLPRYNHTPVITLSQFQESLRRVWFQSQHVWAGRRREALLPRRLGLAVSGGADSMALAYLCKQWEEDQRNSGDDITVTALVVDHKAREESFREAVMVSKWLNNIGLKTQILELSWPLNDGPVTAFETHARRLRFQALGKACRDRQIDALLMGHHQDDNVETTLWRLSSGARGPGLAGIPPMTRIPECHGIYGVCESGSSTTLKLREMDSRKLCVTSNGEIQALCDNSSKRNATQSLTMSTGGIFICRPLLSFPKASLLATCHENDIPYVSDPTNFDPTLTPRNAIRSMISSRTLPRALQTPSIISLIESSQKQIQESARLSDQLLQKCELLDTNLATGTIVIRFPSSPSLSSLYEPSSQSQTSSNRRLHQIQALTLRRITEILSPFPENHFPVRSFEKFTHRVFTSNSAGHQPTSASKREAFTLGGVMFQPIHWPLSSTPQDAHDTPTSEVAREDQSVWLLSRQPYMRNRLPVHRYEVPISPQGNYTPWSLWDDRYWFRFVGRPDQMLDQVQTEQIARNASQITVVVRPFQPSDLQTIRKALYDDCLRLGKRPPKGKNPAMIKLLECLAQEAPGQIRFRLPLVAVEIDVGKTKQEVPLALPTLELLIPGMREALQRAMGSKSPPWLVQWEWMYKMIDTGTLKSMGSL